MSISTKQLCKNHLTEKRFKAYAIASKYIKNLNNVYKSIIKSRIPDEAYNSSQNFKAQQPTNSDFKVSLLPKSHISIELLNKAKLLHKFHNLEEIKPNKIKVSSRSSSPAQIRSVKSEKLHMSEYRNFLCVSESKEKRCGECRKKTCECVDKTKDEFLMSFLKSRTSERNEGKEKLEVLKKYGSKKLKVKELLLNEVVQRDNKCNRSYNVKSSRVSKVSAFSLNRKTIKEIYQNQVDSCLSVSQLPYSERPNPNFKYKYYC